MPGAFITQGMDVQVSNLKVSLDGSEPPSMTFKVRVDTWHHWMTVACDNTAMAGTQENILRNQIAVSTPDNDMADFKSGSLEAEFRAAMTALAACAFAVDAFYATILERFGEHPDSGAWKRNRTARHAQIAATLHDHLKIKNAAMPTVRQFIKEIFNFRDLAVHPHARFQEPIHREDLDAGVEPRFVTFSARHARLALGLTVELMTSLTDKAGEVATGDNAKWAEFARGRADVVKAAAMSTDGVEFPAQGR